MTIFKLVCATCLFNWVSEVVEHCEINGSLLSQYVIKPTYVVGVYFSYMIFEFCYIVRQVVECGKT